MKMKLLSSIVGCLLLCCGCGQNASESSSSPQPPATEQKVQANAYLDAVLEGPGLELRLDSDYIPVAIRVRGDRSGRDIHSVRMVGKVPAEGDGAANIWLDARLAELNTFGDVVRRVGAEPTPTRVELRYAATSAGPNTNLAPHLQDSRASQGFRLYDLVFPGGALDGQLKLVLGTATLGPHRLLAYSAAPSRPEGSAESPDQIIPLHGLPTITSILPDNPLRPEIGLSGFYIAADGRIHGFGVGGTLGGAGTLGFDPNYITFDRFGEPVMSTLIGCHPYEITLSTAEERDPLNKGRRLYWAISKDPRYTDRVALVLGRTEIGPHRILLYHGDQVESVVSVELASRRRQEISASELTVLSQGEQQALSDLRKSAGYGFQFRIEKGDIVGLTLTGDSGRVPSEGVLARLPHLRFIEFGGGRYPATGVADLRQLTQLRSLFFDNTEFQADSLATLKDLGQLESLTFYDCRGITDEGVKHLAGMTQLKRLSFYSERLHRQPDKEPCITDTGVAYLKPLIHLESLDLFGHDVSDRSVEVLTGMRELQSLSLSGHGFTDAGLDGLAKLPKLRSLRLFETSVTTSFIGKLKARLPELKVEAWELGGSG